MMGLSVATEKNMSAQEKQARHQSTLPGSNVCTAVTHHRDFPSPRQPPDVAVQPGPPTNTCYTMRHLRDRGLFPIEYDTTYQWASEKKKKTHCCTHKVQAHKQRTINPPHPPHSSPPGVYMHMFVYILCTPAVNEEISFRPAVINSFRLPTKK